MTFIHLITGLMIAAMLHVPGTKQHEAAQVGDEPVVERKEHMVKQKVSSISTVWYGYTGPLTMPGYDPNNASNYTKLGESEEPDCTNGSIVCAVNLPENGTSDHPDPNDLNAIQGEISSPSPEQTIVRKFTP